MGVASAQHITTFIDLSINIIIHRCNELTWGHSKNHKRCTKMASVPKRIKKKRLLSNKVAKTYSYKEVEYTFVDTVPEDLVCPICHELLDEAQQTPCGHLFCKKCLEKVKKYSISLVQECSVCKSKYTKAPCDDPYNERRVKSLAVKCPNPPCPWIGSLTEVGKHITSDSGCQYVKVKCPKECGEETTRGRLILHQRNSCPFRAHHCQFCNKEDTYRNITTKHYEICEQFPLPCPNKCGIQQIPKKEIEHHLAECPEQIVKCPYVEMGCHDTVARRHLDRHKEERKDHHLSIAVERVSQLCGAVSQLYGVCEAQSKAKLQRPVFSCQRKWLENEKTFPSMPWVVKLENVERAKANDSTMQSTPFFTHPTGHQFCLRVHSSIEGEQYTTAFITAMAGPSDAYLQWPFRGRFQVTILNQMADNEHISNEVEYMANEPEPSKIYADGTEVGLMILPADLQRKESINCQYLMDDCLYFRVMLV